RNAIVLPSGENDGDMSGPAADVSSVSWLVAKSYRYTRCASSRAPTYASLRLSGDQTGWDSSPAVLVTRVASPGSFDAAAKMSPCATNAIFLPSGDNARS